jgi:ribosome-associated protein
MDVKLLLKEVSYTAVRSGGPGGQHANKVASKVVLHFNLKATNALSELEKTTANHQLSSKLSKDGLLNLTCDDSRSQHENKEIVTERFLKLMRSSIKRPKKRIPTKISKSKKVRRLESKKKMAVKKSLRQKPKLD